MPIRLTDKSSVSETENKGSNPLLAVTCEEFRVHMAETIGRVEFGKERVLVSKYGRPVAVLLSYAEYMSLLEY